ncbi:Sorting nexin [Fasciolopsis buskii]|uniref:Sorting nexin n=1 Tax=Fasciolopsis buskii TaxID=27845 RepID=A0A8E0S9Q7_9TREM|nr:Sorting nexin [Fasciolopsis buski]
MEENPTSIYHDTVSIGGGTAFPQIQPQSRPRSESLMFNEESPLVVEISGAMSDKDRVLFTIHTKTTLPDFEQGDCSVKRMHEEFEWLHDYLVENESYAGYIDFHFNECIVSSLLNSALIFLPFILLLEVPPMPPRPDFDSSRAKLQRLGESEGSMPKEDLQKMKAELEAEYLATFKKTVAMHEVFLQRLATHPLFRSDHNFRVFLKYPKELSVRTKTRKEKAAEFFRSVSKTADETLRLTNQRDEDQFFREEKCILASYYTAVKDATAAADVATRARRSMSESLLRVNLALDNLVPKERLCTSESDLISILSSFFESYQKIQSRLASDEDLKFSDTLRYYASDAGAAKDLLYRRSRALADYEAANRNLDKARAKAKDIEAAEDVQFAADERFKSISDSARLELEYFKVRRIKYFQKNLIDLAELQVKHAKSHIDLVKSALDRLRSVEPPVSGNSETNKNAASPDTEKTARLSTTSPAELPAHFQHEPISSASAFT